MNSTVVSWALSAALAASMGLLGKMSCSNMKLEERTSQLNQKLMESDLELGRAQTKFDDANKYIGTLEQGIQAEIKEREAVATRFAQFKTDLKTKKEVVVVTTEEKIVYKEKIIIRDLNLKVGGLYQAAGGDQLYEVKMIPFRYQDHRLLFTHTVVPQEDTLDFEHRAGYELSLRFTGQLVETHTPEGAVNNYLSIFEVDQNGKIVGQLSLEEFTTIVDDQRASQFRLWAPHLDIGGIFGADTNLEFKAGLSVGVSFMGYGLTKNDLSWRFLRLSMDLKDPAPGIGFTPVQWNLGGPIPLISNLWLGPHVTYGLKNDWFLGLMTGAVL